MVNMLPAIVGSFGIIALCFYKLTPNKVKEFRKDLEAGKHQWDVAR